MLDYSENFMNVVAMARKLAQVTGGLLATEHLLFGLSAVEGSFSQKVLKGWGINKSDFSAFFDEKPYSEKVAISKRAEKGIDFAGEIAEKFNAPKISTEHLLFGLLDETDCIAVKFLHSRTGLDSESLQRKLYDIIINNAGYYPEKVVASNNYSDAESKLNDFRAEHMTGNIESAPAELESLGEDLTKKAAEGRLDEVIGRDKEIERVIQILCRRTKNNAVLIGEPGVGKTAVIEGLAQAIADNKVPELLQGKTLFSLDLASLLAGTKYRGDLEERVKNTLSVIKQKGDVILFIDEIHTMLKAGASEGGLDVSNILKPMLARGELQTIGATTLDEYRKEFCKDPALERRFQPVRVDEPTVSETIEMLHRLKDKYEMHHSVAIKDDAISAAAVYSQRYIRDRFLPDKAIDLIDEACSKKKIDSRGGALYIDESDIAEIITEWTGIPASRISEDEIERLKNLEESLSEKVIGQGNACDVIAKAIKRSRAGLKDPNRPIGSFIFMGPTGVGKTELAKALAKELFGDENMMIRIDMSEYMSKDSVSRLIGAAPGLVGFEEGGQLTEKIRRKPYSVVLFDEIEKGHPDIYNLLLQILEDGILTDSQGSKVSFKDAVIIMTSNIGAKESEEEHTSFGFGASSEEEVSKKDLYTKALKDFMRPEVINRIDEIVVFDKLSKDNLREVAMKMLEKLDERVQEQGLEFGLTRAAKDYIIECGYDPDFGARPLRRTIQHLVEDKLSEAIINGEFIPGDKIKIDFNGTKLTFEKFLEE
ncbi:MAG: ATP-dependent Clp protease ATP-binding subunit [Clostridia bacterium]|nr:ATP-dependent Clp protease ATP-binding subunit [Clostridia bacterium]